MSAAQTLQGTAKILRKAAAILQRGWGRYTLARNAGGTPVDIENPQAVKFCAVGALIKAGDTKDRAFLELRVYVRETFHFDNVSDFNDMMAHREPVVAAMIATALKLEREVVWP